METLTSGTKKRILPSWMTAQVTQKSRGQETSPKRRKTTAAAAAARLPAVRTAYCMSEAELVDVALGILVEDRKQEKLSEQPFLAGADKPELPPTSSVSSSASSSPRSPGRSEDEDNGQDALPPGLSPSQEPGGPASACSSSSAGEDEDALKYVREIFFS